MTTALYGIRVGFLIIGAVLSVLDISLTFDNAIVNANALKELTLVWQKRFLTWVTDQPNRSTAAGGHRIRANRW